MSVLYLHGCAHWQLKSRERVDNTVIHTVIADASMKSSGIATRNEERSWSVRLSQKRAAKSTRIALNTVIRGFPLSFHRTISTLTVAIPATAHGQYRVQPLRGLIQEGVFLGAVRLARTGATAGLGGRKTSHTTSVDGGSVLHSEGHVRRQVERLGIAPVVLWDNRSRK